MTQRPAACTTCPSASGPSRRQVVTGATAAAALAGPALTACGSSEEGTGTATGDPITVAAADVPVGGGVISGAWVVTQPEKGTFKAFSTKCTHQGCAVSEIAEQQIICACHGSYFGIADGAPQAGPAQEPLAEAVVEQSGDQLTVTPPA